jgi:hypothetical protein
VEGKSVEQSYASDDWSNCRNLLIPFDKVHYSICCLETWNLWEVGTISVDNSLLFMVNENEQV